MDQLTHAHEDADPTRVVVIAPTRAEFDAEVKKWSDKGYLELGNVVHIRSARGGGRRCRVPESWNLTMYRPRD